MRIAAVVACAIGVVGGAWVARWFGAGPRIDGPGLGEVEERLDRLDESVRALSEELETWRAQGTAAGLASEPRPASGDAPVASRTELVAPLRDELDALSASVQTLLAELRTAREDPAKVNPPVPKNDVLLGELIQRREADSKAVDAQHFCWTTWQVFHRYGQPDWVRTSGAQEISWGYVDRARRRELFFTFVGGVVTNVGVWETSR